MKIVFLDAITIGDVPNLSLFKKLGDYTQYEQTTPGQIIERCKDAKIVITNKVVFNKEILSQLPKLQLLTLTATGMNNVDLDYAKEKGIEVKNVADYSTESVAQTTFSMVLALVNQISYYDGFVKSGKYSNQSIFTHIGDGFWELKGKRYGIIGMGNIGRRVSTIAKAFGCEVVYYSTSGKNNQQEYQQVDLEELLRSSKIVSIHAPLNEKTNNLIGKKELHLMDKTSVLVNVGRGGIVNEHDLADAIDNDVIAGACTDVFSVEPIEKNNPLCQIKKTHKVIHAPHIAWASIEARTLLIEKTFLNIKTFIET